jgi:phosphoribosylformylglycinamidine (FGAM) synthase-like amidotransferase family enzyme
VLGAGGGWAASVLFHERTRAEFERFFRRTDAFSLGVCNGCQMMALLRDLIPGAAHWPRFLRNRSEQFEGRATLVEILDSPSVLLDGMAGSRLPVAVAHGEGRPEFGAGDLAACVDARLVAYRFIDNRGAEATRYPANPNGAVQGIAALTTPDGRTTIMMPHPERVFRTVQNSWHPDEAGEDSGGCGCSAMRVVLGRGAEVLRGDGARRYGRRWCAFGRGTLAESRRRAMPCARDALSTRAQVGQCGTVPSRPRYRRRNDRRCPRGRPGTKLAGASD